MKLLKVMKDGGPKSHVTGLYLIEIKSLFCIIILKFGEGTREAYHSHAFNAITLWLKGRVTEHMLDGTSRDWSAGKIKYTSRNTFHKVFAHVNSYAVSVRGPWSKTWREFLPEEDKFVTLTHGRKVIARYHPGCRDDRDRMISLVYEWEYKKAFAEYKQSLGCSRCGYKECAAALDFHHKDPNTKEKKIGNFCKVFHTPKAREELSKCVLLCSNCHRAKHWGKINDIDFSVYLAARYARREELDKYAEQLRKVGITVTARWLDEKYPSDSGLNDLSPEENKAVSAKDLDDIRDSDAFVLFTEQPTEAHVRGGRHFESGFAQAIGKHVITVGPRENIFHFLDDIPNFLQWKSAKIYLVRLYVSKRQSNVEQPAWVV